MASEVTSIVDNGLYLTVINEGQSMEIKKAYVEVAINNYDADIVDFKFHWYERNSGKRVFNLDYNRVVTPATASAAALMARIETMFVSGIAGDETALIVALGGII